MYGVLCGNLPNANHSHCAAGCVDHTLIVWWLQAAAAAAAAEVPSYCLLCGGCRLPGYSQRQAYPQPCWQGPKGWSSCLCSDWGQAGVPHLVQVCFKLWLGLGLTLGLFEAVAGIKAQIEGGLECGWLMYG